MSLDPSTQALIAYLTIFLAPGIIGGAISHWTTPRIVHQAQKAGISDQESATMRKATSTSVSVVGISIIAFPILLSWTMPLIGEHAVQIYKDTFILAFFVYLLVALLVDGLLLAFVRPNPEFERAATQRILTEVEESNKNPGDKENKPEPELVICNIPLYPPTTDRQPFKALRDMTRKTGKETPVDKPDTDTGKPGDNDVKL